jgi:hypothetical protein
MMIENLKIGLLHVQLILGVLAFSFGGEYSVQVVRQKLIRPGLLKEEEGQSEVALYPTSAKPELPDELLKVERGT